ncbi:MAG: amidohydrolase [Blastocatellia bacterium]|nr:amidohydrolase [Blastocatellia bacterium]
MKQILSKDDAEELVATRRILHQFPELKFQETRTAKLVSERLQKLGYRVTEKVAGTGVVTVLDTGKPGPTIALRADMDALPVTEENSVEYCSKHQGVMHACGHDGHVSILLSTAKQLQACRDQLSGKIKLIFQPGEEGGNGALKMIDEGVLDSPKVDVAFGLHLWNGLQVGKVGICAGPIMASVDEFKITVIGRGGHGAIPHQTVDSIVVASQIVVALQTIVSRNVDPLDSAVVTVGKFSAGNTFNVIAEQAVLSGTIRTFSQEMYQQIPKLFERVVKGTALSFGADVEIDYQRQCMPTINNSIMAEFVRSIATTVVGSDNVVSNNQARTMAGEDMSYFLSRVPGCFFFVGSKNENKGLNYPHHSPRFDFDEEAMPIGVEIMKQIAIKFADTKGQL